MIHGSLDFVRSEEGHPAILSASDIVIRASATSVEEEEEELRLLLSDDIAGARCEKSLFFRHASE